MSNALSVTDQTFQHEVIESDQPVLVDFWATWCGPCKMIAPIVDDLATEYAGKVKVVKVDVDANPMIPGSFGIMSIPTLMLFKNGLPVERVVGFQPKAKLAASLNQALAS